MKISSTRFLNKRSVQSRIGQALSKGETVYVPIARTKKEIDELTSTVRKSDAVLIGAMPSYFHTPLYRLDANAERAVSQHVRKVAPDWTKEQRLMIGIGGGAAAGGGGALLCASLARGSSPQMAVVATIAGALCGSGMMALFASGVLAEVEVSEDSIKLHGARASGDT